MTQKKKRAKRFGTAGSPDPTTELSSSTAVRLRHAVGVVEVAESLTSPLTRSIENLLRLAAQTMGSDEASVLVRDGNKGGLRFLVAIGDVAEKLMRVRIPPGKGIAGFVFSSGQPMAVADVASEETFYAEVDRKTGYSTHTLLATPLRADGEMVGVLEFVNRIGDPPYDPFTPDEMDKAAHYAEAIATLVEAREAASLIETLFQRILTQLGNAKRGGDETTKELRKWLDRVRSAPEHKDMIALAVLLREITARGDAERALAKRVLESLSEYLRDSDPSNFGYLGF
jgi:transcriptional regulator with GAF, ATPase, and Fis domain